VFWRQTFVVCATAAVVLLGLTACASSSSTPPRVRTVNVVTGASYSADVADCRGHLPQAINVGPLVTRTRLKAAVACMDLGGITAGRATAQQTERLASALSSPSAPARSNCDASGSAAIAFVVQLQNGRWVHPPIPSDGCHPSERVMAVLSTVARH
jgi:hypothetical protein